MITKPIGHFLQQTNADAPCPRSRSTRLANETRRLQAWIAIRSVGKQVHNNATPKTHRDSELVWLNTLVAVAAVLVGFALVRAVGESLRKVEPNGGADLFEAHISRCHFRALVPPPPAYSPFLLPGQREYQAISSLRARAAPEWQQQRG